MNFVNTWAAIFNPGDAPDCYFDQIAHRPFPEPLDAYSPVNAWWLSEVSRLVYRLEGNEVGGRATGRTRGQILSDVGLKESLFVDAGGSQAAVVEPLDAGSNPFVVIAFRGTDTLLDWLDFNVDLAPVRWEAGGKVHRGFKEAFDAVWNRLEPARRPGVPLIFTGHSLGGALATLAASRQAPTSTYTFGSPRVGDAVFGATVPRQAFFRIVNNRDLVTDVPTLLEHVGSLRYIAHDGRIVADPDESTIRADRTRRDPSFDRRPDLVDKLTGPPQELADHAPVNYVAHLERAVSGSGTRD